MDSIFIYFILLHSNSEEERRWINLKNVTSRIESVREEEVSECSPWWKSPCVLFYSSPEALHAKDVAGIS